MPGKCRATRETNRTDAAERGPAWHQLGEVTKSVWYGYVLAGVELPLW